jgi:hypothetical protein
MTVAADDGIRLRLIEVRAATALTQTSFADRLNEASRALYGEHGPRYRQGNVTKLETGAQYASLADVAVYAMVDPKRRGKLWLGWDESDDASMRRTHGPSVIKPTPDEMFDRAPLPRRKPAAKKQA